MKQTTCKNLRGACDEVITGNTPEEMAENSKAHVMELLQAGDNDHQVAVNSMMALSREEQMKWFEGFVSTFDQLEDA